ncbi:MAG: hypothetical protein H0T79_23205 [Deltaproteobacteria bacterium]|nr:hypothetical protein [Deltaproteobacteria bacterium]
MLRVTLALVSFGAAACGGTKPADPGPSCEAIMPHLAVVMKQGLTGHGTVEFGNQKRDVLQCQARKLTAEQRRCLMATKTVADISACNAGQSPTAPIAPVAPSPRRLPTPSGSDVPQASPGGSAH